MNIIEKNDTGINMARFNDMMKSYRKDRGISQAELAKIIGVSTSTIGMYESEKRHPNFKTEEAIADYFNVTLDMLRGQGDESSEHISKGYRIPVLGKVAAGIPQDAIEDILDYELISPDVADIESLFGLKIKGDSMEPDFRDGDVVIVHKQDNANEGDIVIAAIDNNDAVCKKFEKERGTVILKSLNSKYVPMKFNSRSDKQVTIIGKVIELRRKI